LTITQVTVVNLPLFRHKAHTHHS